MRVHDAIFITSCAVGIASLIGIYVGAAEREANKIVVSLDPLDELRGEDSQEIAELMRAIYRPEPDATLPDVVVILLDGVRSEAIDPAAPESALMPALSAWAQGARRWPAAVASSPGVVSSRASILTGLSPSEHRLRRNSSGDFSRIRWEQRSLVSLFEDAGYLTLGLSAHRQETVRRHAMHRGYDLFVDVKLPVDSDRLPYTRADRLTDAALSMADAVEDEPLFLWVNYSDAQIPWMPWDEWIEEPLNLMGSVIWTPTGGGRGGWKKRRKALMSQDPEKGPSEHHLRTWQTLWEGELQLLDREVARLLEGLADRGLDERVIVLGTGGVSLGEHALLGAGLGVYQEAISTPFLARAPGLEAGDAPGTPDSTDAYPLILSLIDDEVALEIDDRAVSEAWYAPREDLEAESYGEQFQGVRRAFIDGERKLIVDSRGSVEAYELSTDPAELSPLDGAEWIEPMRAEAEAWIERAMSRGGASTQKDPSPSDETPREPAGAEAP